MLSQAAEAIRRGGVVLCPAEGVYGLSCDARNAAALKRVLAIKQRPSGKGLIVIVPDRDRLGELCAVEKLDARALSLMERMWPGPHTFIVPARPDLPPLLTGGRPTLAVRVSAFAPLRELCLRAGCPLVSTSANRSGAEAVDDFAALDPAITSACDVVIDLPCGGARTPSSIYDTLEGRLIRKGSGFPPL